MDAVGIAAEPGFNSHGGISKNRPNLFIDPSHGGIPYCNSDEKQDWRLHGDAAVADGGKYF